MSDDVAQKMNILRAQERGIVRQLREMEEECPNGRDYERQAEFRAAYEAYQERRTALDLERRDCVMQFMALRRISRPS